MTNKTDSLGFNRLNLMFGLLMLVTIVFFLYWGIEYTDGKYNFVFILSAIFGLFMAFNIGGNDVANSFGTSVGAGTLSLKQALIVAAIFEISGAMIAGGEVTDTIRNGIVDISMMEEKINIMQFVYIMMSALIAAALWLLVATKMGWPVSTTHSIIGGIVGAAVVLGNQLEGVDPLAMVQWNKIQQIVLSWIISPLLGGVMSYILFSFIKKQVLDFNDHAETMLTNLKEEKKTFKKAFKQNFKSLSTEEKLEYNNALARDAQANQEPDVTIDDFETEYYRKIYEIDIKKSSLNIHAALQTWVPALACFGAVMITAMLLFKGLKHARLELSTLNNYFIISMVGAAVWMGTYIYAKTLKNKGLETSTFLIFSWMQVFTAAGFAFSHGSNDIANAIGPFAAILDSLKNNAIGTKAAVPTVVMLTFGISLIVGLWFIGKTVIATVGTHLTKMHPASGFTAELSAASVVMLASVLGLPVSSTHILVGAVLGIGIVNHNANWKLMRPIALAWIITVPASAALAIIAFLCFRSFI